ncbi:hypothetical protein ABVT39_017966 [Epinephelus coioides]
MRVIADDVTVAVWHILSQSVKAAGRKQRTTSDTDYGINSGHYKTFLPPPCVQPAYKDVSGCELLVDNQ